jgi:hypothetical protein
MRWIALAVIAVITPLSLLAASQLPQGLKSQPLPLPGGTATSSRPGDAVQFLLPDEIRVEARHPALVDLRFRVADGLHINAHAPRDKTLIATRLAVIEGQGFRVTAVDFPPGADFAPAFAPHEKLSVYSGEFVLEAHLIAEPGEHLLEAKLRYQACDKDACMPPRSLPIVVNVIAK